MRQWFKQLDHDQHAHEGRAILEKELARLGIQEKPQLDQIAQRYNFKRGEDVLAAIGRGDLSVGVVARQVGEPRTPPPAKEPAKEQAKEPSHRPRPAPGQKSTGSGGEVVVEGVDDLMTQIANCCKPVPYDPIVGFVTRGRGVTVHRKDCPNVLHLSEAEAERLMQVRWAAQHADSSYPVDVLVIASDRKALLRDVSSVFADDDVYVLGSNTHSDRSTDTAAMRFTVEVRDHGQLEAVLAKLRQVPYVIEVRRTY